MQLTNEQIITLAAVGLTAAIESVVYAHDKGMELSDDMVEDLRQIVLKSKELLSL